MMDFESVTKLLWGGECSLCVGTVLFTTIAFLYANMETSKTAIDILSATDEEYVERTKPILLDAETKAMRKANGGKDLTYTDHASFVSTFLKQKVIDVHGLMRSNAHELFLIHRDVGAIVEGGLGVRLTVQLNLFGGSVANLGNDTQRQWLQEVFTKGELGCFCLTEAGAGVLSGLIVNTTATFVPGDKAGFVMHTPSAGARKTWISQGLTAKWGVVIARLLLPGNIDKGPHAFVIDMSLPGVEKEDMPSKTDFNGLDNANIWFDRVTLPLSSLLSGISAVTTNGDYVLTNPEVPFRFVQVAQRLLAGRICIAGAAIMQLRKVYDAVREYSGHRLIPTGKDSTTPLAEIPVMRDTLQGIDASMMVFRHFVQTTEESFMHDDEITAPLVDRIACGKVEAVGYCIDAILNLKKRVGSLSLQETGPFGSETDILYVYRFAEGDSAILQQKLVRDALKKVGSLSGILSECCKVPWHWLLNRNGVGIQRATLSMELVKLAAGMIGLSSKRKTSKWFESHIQIERIAKLKAMLTIYDSVAQKQELAGTRELALFKCLHLDPL